MSGMPDLPDEKDVKRRQMILVGGLIVVIILVLIYVFATNPALQGQQQREPSVEVDLTTPAQSSDPIQNWVLQNENKLSAYEEQQKRQQEETQRQFQALRDELQRLRADNEALQQKLEQGAASTASPSGGPVVPLPPRSSLPVVNTPLPLPVPKAAQSGKPNGKTPAAPGSATGGPALMDQVLLKADEQPRIVKVKFSRKKGKGAGNHIRDTLPAGTFIRAALLSGVDAPTGGLAERHPVPVLLEFIDNGSLPNSFRHRVRRCRLVGTATGNISDERAYVRLERLTCVLRNGDIISQVATGAVTGEDGKNGLRGRLVSKQGQIIANAFLAGSLSNIGNAVAQSYTTVATTATGTVSTLDPSRVFEAGAAGGMGTTLEKIADWYFKRAEETFPIIEISAGRVVDVFLTEDLRLGANLLSNYTPDKPHE